MVRKMPLLNLGTEWKRLRRNPPRIFHNQKLALTIVCSSNSYHLRDLKNLKQTVSISVTTVTVILRFSITWGRNKAP